MVGILVSVHAEMAHPDGHKYSETLAQVFPPHRQSLKSNSVHRFSSVRAMTATPATLQKGLIACLERQLCLMNKVEMHQLEN